MAIESIAKTLGTGSGIDITSLVDQLVTAQTSAKAATLTQKGEALTAQISAVSSLKSSVSAFDSALTSLIRGGTLQTQPTSSNSAVVKVSTLTGSSVASLSASIEVQKLAAAQVASSAVIADATAPLGTGSLRLTFGSATVADGVMTGFDASSAAPIDIAITADNSSLQGIAAAINAKQAGVTASVLTDADGARLVLKGATGGAQAFTLTATEDAGAEGLAALAIGVGESGTTIGSAAQDAVVAVDGVAIRRSTNSVLDLVPGVRLDLVSALPGTRVTLGTQAPSDALQQAVGDVVDTYNELYAQLKEATNAVDGPLRADSAAKQLLRQLADLTTKVLVPDAAAGTPRSLSEIGVQTNRDGTLKLDAATLTKALLNNEANVEAMFKLGSGLSAALGSVATFATSTSAGLGASETRYTSLQSALSDQQTKALEAAETLRTRMTRQFATMDAVVASYKSTQTFLQAQVDAWNSDN